MIAITDFDEQPYQIPYRKEVENTFDSWFEEQRVELLQNLFGIQFATLFLAGLDEESVQEKWAKLDTGENYERNGKTYIWRGMKYLLKPALWSMWLTHNYGTPGLGGMVVQDAENSQVVNPALWACDSWNEYVKRVGLVKSIRYYKGFLTNYENTLYGYMEAKSTTYADGNLLWTAPSTKLRMGF